MDGSMFTAAAVTCPPIGSNQFIAIQGIFIDPKSIQRWAKQMRTFLTQKPLSSIQLNASHRIVKQTIHHLFIMHNPNRPTNSYSIESSLNRSVFIVLFVLPKQQEHKRNLINSVANFLLTLILLFLEWIIQPKCNKSNNNNSEKTNHTKRKWQQNINNIQHTLFALAYSFIQLPMERLCNDIVLCR